jgi:hypothetical protein
MLYIVVDLSQVDEYVLVVTHAEVIQDLERNLQVVTTQVA